MDQLRADLAQRGIHALPRGWQFVHIDVPIAPDGVGRGMPPTVSAQGGRYVGLAHPGANYPATAQAVETRLRTVGELRQLATWRPDPATVGVPIADGAGQQRAIGRLLAVAKAPQIAEHLAASFAALLGHGVTGELAEVADQFSPATRGQVDGAPVVMVISSMAGGAGASMVLDVCRLLTLIDGYDPRATGLFLFTPEVFGSLPPHARGGIDGNALAMAGELIAAQVGAGAESDAAILRAMGLSLAEENVIPFGRVFPVGAKVGATGTPFGDGSAIGVYRGLGRGLAALMLSGQATHELVGYDIVTPPFRSTKQDTLGWGVDGDALMWGSFGFASLGLGRERYAEYAAQRLARAAVDRLVDGHLQPGDPRSATDQLRALNDAKWGHFCQRVGLPSNAEDVQAWFVSLLDAAPLETAAAGIVEDTAGRRLQLSQPVDLQLWLPVLLQQVAQDAVRMNERIESAAYTWAFDWHRGLLIRLEAELAQIVVESGLAAGRELLVRVVDAADRWVHTLRLASDAGAADVYVLSPDIRHKLTAVKGMVDASHASVQLLRHGFFQNTFIAVRHRCAANAGAVLQSFIELLKPLANGCDDALKLLMAARTAHPVDTGLARLRTDDYASWPDGTTQIPRRFFEAHNELLLTSAEAFPREFDAHVAATEPGRPVRDGLNTIVDQVIRGRWQTAGAQVNGRIVERLATWRPVSLPTDPHNATAPPSPPSAGQYRIAVRPNEILERARAWVQRPKEPFDSFISQSLRDYLTGTDVGEAEQAKRTLEVHRRFQETLELARPLVAVNGASVSALHGTSVQISYKFSDVPFAGLPLSSQLVEELTGSGDVEQSSAGRLEKVLRSDSRTTRVDIFSSYGPLSPATFSSLLSPLDRRWASCVTVESRNEFWRLRRARRLAGCLPMGAAQRRATIGGWYVARLTRQLRLPDEHVGSAVEVWDDHQRTWVAFPQQLLIDKEDFRTPMDVLGAVLLSSLVAFAHSHQFPELDPLRPYTLMRQMWDDTVGGRDEKDPVLMLAAARRLSGWLLTDETPPGAPPARPDAPADPEERRTDLLNKLKQLHGHLGRQYLAPGELGAPGGGDFSVLDRPDTLSRVPLYHELAPDVYAIVGQLIELVGTVTLGGSAQERDLLFDEVLG
jgi:hypothetical protein